MFAIRLSDSYLDLFPSTSFNLQLNNPLFDTESFARAFSFPFSLPDTPQNLQILEFPDRFDTTGKRIFQNAFLYIEQINFLHGEIIINNIAKGKINIVFRNTTLAALEQLEKTNLRTILDTIAIPKIVTAFYDLKFAAGKEWYTLSVNQTPIIYTAIIGVTTMQDVIAHFLEAINDPFYIRAVGSQIGADSIRISPSSDEDIRIDNLTNLDIIATQASPDANIINMKAYVAEVVNTPIPEMTFPCIVNREKYGTENKEWVGFFNFFRGGEQITNVGHDEKFWFHTWSPCIRIPYIFLKICQAIGLTKTTSDFLTHPENQELILFTNIPFDKVTEEKDTSINTTFFINGHRSKLNLNDFVPDKTAKQFLIDFLNFFCLYAEVKNNELHIIPKTNQLNQPPLDFTNKAETIIEKQLIEKEGFTLAFSQGKKDTIQVIDTSSLSAFALNLVTNPNPDTFVVTNQLLDLKVGSGKKKIAPAFSTLYDYVYTYDLPTVPIKHGNHTLKVPTLGTKDEVYRLLFYRGLKTDSLGKSYPFASHGITDLHGNIIGTFSLDWTGLGGLYERCWKDYLQLLEADSYTLYLRLNVLDFIQLREWKNAKISIQTEKGQIIGIIKYIQTQISLAGLGLSKVTLARI